MTEFDRIEVACFNLHWGCGGDGIPFDVTAACAALGADVIGLQEVWTPGGGPSAAARAASELGYGIRELPLTRMADIDGFRVVEREPEATGSWGLAVLTRFPVVGHRVLDLGRAAGDTVRRAALSVVLELPSGGTLHVVNTHLTHRLHAGPRQLRRLVRRLGPVSDAVVMGDLNMVGPAAAVLARRRRAVTGRTWPAGRPVAQLDHILVPRRYAVAEGEVLPGLGSDHRPVRAALLPRAQ
ncbi:hypothetical protein FKN01_00095 [Streptomyces sp. 130]|uniref:endonuclease/exonuclease/phosphatase family protein n=1 Tax=Streptomyces sp. 130 TaxID=2591006 RepID=UPI00118090DC|nr:endonuclease/exonuclease/phosphatase family protein [Streptomyces sp. 130]TRV81755.1 hypothetical protein FKN01_00095 [Streptomyces sp. 130]